MQLFGKDLFKEVVVVAEIGVNHEGDVNAASRLLELAAGTGVNAVKFQTYSSDRFISSSNPDLLERVERFSLSESEFRRLSMEAKELGVAFFSTAVTEDAIPLVDELGEAIKIASGDLTFEPVIRAAAQTNKPIILSTGLGVEAEIDRAVAWVRDEVGDHRLSSSLILLHCVSAYPTPLEQTNVRSVPYLATRYGIQVGYSHHAVELEPCLSAVALGASVVEVHFTDCKYGREFRDHALSVEAEELSRLVDMIRKIRTSLGDLNKERQECEQPLLEVARKGIVAACDLEVGTVIEKHHVMFARPATDFPADSLSEVIGKKLTVSLCRGEILPRVGVEAID